MDSIAIPEFCAVVLIGPSGCGKSTLAARCFKPTEALSSDALRGMVADDPDAADATADAFAVLRDILARRLARRLLTVVDSTNLRPEERAQLVEIAQAAHAPTVAVLVDADEKTCRARRPDTPRPAIARHCAMMRKSWGGVKHEHFTQIVRLGQEEAAAAAFVRAPLLTDRRADAGPFDIVGDVHGCHVELTALLARLGYDLETLAHPGGRRLVFLGDVSCRGPAIAECWDLVMRAVAAGHLCVPGNHDAKTLKWLRLDRRPGREVSMDHGFDETVRQIDAREAAEPGFKVRLARFIDGLPSHYLLDGGALAVAHAGVKEGMQARASRLVRDFCLYGETTGETDEFGLPVRFDWAAGYRGKAAVVHGHVATTEPKWVNNTIDVDTGCVYGGALTALRWPERELVSVPAERVWCEPVRPVAPAAPARPELPDLSELAAGKLRVETRWGVAATVQADQSAAALEALARFSVDPRWMLFPAPTTATVDSAKADGLLERTEEALDHYVRAGVERVFVEEKHMGSRCVAVVCRDRAAAARRFGDGSRQGALMSKSGRPFFAAAAEEAALLERMAAAAGAAGLWEELSTDWLLMDGEMLPWAAKAGRLIRDVFAGTGCAGAASAGAQRAALEAAAARGVPGAAEAALRAAERERAMASFRAAYAPYTAPCGGPEDLRYAPFHVLASEGRLWDAVTHDRHMAVADRLFAADPALFRATRWMEANPAAPEGRAAVDAFWRALLAEGGEGVVVKAPSLAILPRGTAPSIKVRGPEYLRIIYGAEYDRPDVLPGLKDRATGRKRAMARTGLALALEAVGRFVEDASLHLVHEAAFAAVAVGSEPIDSRL
jgi:protein phosphatase